MLFESEYLEGHGIRLKVGDGSTLPRVTTLEGIEAQLHRVRGELEKAGEQMREDLRYHNDQKRR